MPNAAKFDPVTVAAVRAWPQASPERLAARDTHDSAIAADPSATWAAVDNGYDAGVSRMLDGTAEGSGKFVMHAIKLFGRCRVKFMERKPD